MKRGVRDLEPEDRRMSRTAWVVLSLLVALFIFAPILANNGDVVLGNPARGPFPSEVHEQSVDPEDALRELRELREEIEWLDENGDELRRLMDLHEQGKLWSA